MKILIIDNNIDQDCWGASDLRQIAVKAPGATVYVRRAPHGDLPKNPALFDRIIVSGSKTSALDDAPWIEQLIEFTKRAIDRRKPFLGICYGHQTLVRALGGKGLLRKSAQPEYGWTEIEQIESSDLLKDLPQKFFSFSAHFEEASDLPSGMRRLAQSPACSIQATQLESFPIYGLQFHPEKTISEAKRILSEAKKKKEPAVLLRADQSDQLFNPQVGEILFKNFLALETK